MTLHKLAFIGFGNVGRALTRLLTRKSDELRQKYDIEWRVSGIATGRTGITINADGLDVDAAARAVEGGGRRAEGGGHGFLRPVRRQAGRVGS